MTDEDELSSSDPDLSAAPTPKGDSIEELMRRAVHAPAELPELHAGVELVGRFRIERLVGMGGMGAVYLAFDKTLERQVAIKLRHREGAADRLRREAVAMARLAHPNVITVFEAGNIGDQVFVAMEYIAGTTLRAWMQEPHRERERLDVMLAAGRGLAAAHDAGLIHRDFKPENVLIGDDGRPRVGDFGLARGSQSDDEQPIHATSSGQLDSPLTMTGAVLGTPAYMAPEQARGASIDARADQFAFCVVAWEVLCGDRPFAGTSPAELVAAVDRGPRGPGPRRASVRNVLARGLASAPEDRYPDLHALLRAIRRATRRRWPWLVAPIVALGGAAAVIVAMQPTSAISCDGAGAEIETLPRTMAARMRALGTPAAIDGATRVDRSIEAFAARYRELSHGACAATKLDRSWSEDLGVRSHVCLEIARRQAEIMLSPRDVTVADVANLVISAGTLPGLSACGDPTGLAAALSVPSDPARLADVIDARSKLAFAAIAVMVGRKQEATQLVAAIESSPIASEPTVALRLAFTRGELLFANDRLVDAERIWADAYFAARGSGDLEVTLHSVIRLIISSGSVREDTAASDAWIRNGLADASRARRIAPSAAAGVYAAVARVQGVEDRGDEALANGAIALELVGPAPSLPAADVMAQQAENLCAAGRYDDCFALENRALAMTRDIVGPKHPLVAEQLSNFALDRSDANRPAEALAFANEATAIVEANALTSSLQLGHSEVMLAAVISNAETGDRPRPLLVDARRRLVEALGEDHPDVAQIDSNLAVLDIALGHNNVAIARLESALAREERALGPVSSRVADTLYNLAAARYPIGQLDAALAAAKRCAEIRAKIAPNAIGHPGALAMMANVENLKKDYTSARDHARTALAMPALHDPIDFRAMALLQLGRAELGLGEREAAATTLREARAIYDKLGFAARVTECDQLLGRARGG